MAMNVEQTRPFLKRGKFFHDPYPFYERLREVHPIYQGTFLKYRGWFVSGYEEAVTILKDTRFQNRPTLPITTRKYETLKNIQNDMLLFKNKDDHKRMRLLVNRIFTPQMVEGLRSNIEHTAAGLLESIQRKNEMDVIADFAFPLASLIIAKMVGIPIEERQQFRDWSFQLIQTIDFTRSCKSLNDGNELIKKLSTYFQGLIEKRKEQPENDLISHLIKERGEEISEKEVLATCILLMIAGHETTVNLIGNSVYSLLKNPEQLRLLKEHPSLMEQAVEEFLRYESPTQMIARVASEDIGIRDKTIQKGDQVYILLGAANRDPKQFATPHKLDITREHNPHLAFGYGSHFCLGASLARIEAQIALSSFLEKIDNPQLASTAPSWRKLIGFRSLNELQITF